MKKAVSILIVILILAVSLTWLVNAIGGEAAHIPVFGRPSGGGEAAARYRPDGLPDIDPENWSLMLVNADNPLPSDFEVITGLTVEGYLFDKRAVSALDEFLEAGRDAGMQLVLTSAYRTYDYQDMLFQDKVAIVISEAGLDRAGAEEMAAASVARPGTSEHNLGLAADIVCEYYGILDEGYADTQEARWLREHCAEYGFILRYDAGKESLTGIIYEPWHFRYLGKAAARYIMDKGLCLEEFLALYD